MAEENYKLFVERFEEWIELVHEYLSQIVPRWPRLYVVGYIFDAQEISVECVECYGQDCDYETHTVPIKILFDIPASVEKHKEAQALAVADKKRKNVAETKQREMAQLARLQEKYLIKNQRR